MAEGYRLLRPLLPEDLADPLFMRTVDDRPEQADRDSLDIHVSKVRNRGADIGVAERLVLAAVRIDAARDFEGQVTRHEGIGIVQAPFEGSLGLCLPQGQDVRVALVADQSNPRGPSFHQGIGRDRGAVDDGIHLRQECLWIEPVMRRRQIEHVHDAVRELARGRRRLEDLHLAAVLGDHAVGECAADIDADVECHAYPDESSAARRAAVASSSTP